MFERVLTPGMDLLVAVLLLLAALWLLTTLVVLGACRAAARGDLLDRHRRTVHWGSLER